MKFTDRQKVLSLRRYLFQLGLLCCATLALIPQQAALAQSPTPPVRRHTRHGITIDLPAAWHLSDQSTTGAQMLVLTHRHMQAQIVITIHRGVITPTAITRLVQRYQSQSITVQRTVTQTQVGGLTAQGERLRFTLRGHPRTIDVYSAVLAQRTVTISFSRPDRTSPEATPAWDAIRRSLRVG